MKKNYKYTLKYKTLFVWDINSNGLSFTDNSLLAQEFTKDQAERLAKIHDLTIKEIL